MKKLLVMILAGMIALSATACKQPEATSSTGDTSKAESSATEDSSVTEESSTAEESKTEDSSTAEESKTEDSSTAEESKTEDSGSTGTTTYLKDWTADKLNEWFKNEGVFEDESLIYKQDHATYWIDTPVNECAGYMDDDGMYFVGIFTFDDTIGESGVEEFLQKIRDTKGLQLSDEDPSLPIDHLVGNLAFMYSLSADEEFVEKMDAAYEKFVAEVGVTPDF